MCLLRCSHVHWKHGLAAHGTLGSRYYVHSPLKAVRKNGKFGVGSHDELSHRCRLVISGVNMPLNRCKMLKSSPKLRLLIVCGCASSPVSLLQTSCTSNLAPHSENTTELHLVPNISMWLVQFVLKSFRLHLKVPPHPRFSYSPPPGRDVYLAIWTLKFLKQL